MSSHAANTLKQVGSIKNGHLAINAGKVDVTADHAAAVLRIAQELHQFHSLLIYNHMEYLEPHFGTVTPWIDGLAKVENDALKKLIVDTPNQPTNRQSSILVGNLSPMLEVNSAIEELLVVGHFELSELTHPCLRKAEFLKRDLSLDDVKCIANFNCPHLSHLALNSCEDGFPDEFSECFISSLASNTRFTLSDLYIHYSSQGQEIIKGLCDSGLIEKLELLDLQDNELGYDPDVTMEILLKNANTLRQLKTLRVPLNTLMDDEREQLIEAIPCLEHSSPKEGYPADVPWYRPFLPKKYGVDEFETI